MSMSYDERRWVAQAALFNVESEAYVADYNERIEAFIDACPPQELDRLGREHPDECKAITDSIPTSAMLQGLDIIIGELRRFSDLPSEDRGYVALAFMQLHEARTLLLRGFFVRARQEASDAAYRLHWVAKERKRNAQRSAHRMADPQQLEHLDRVSKRVSIWSNRLARPAKVVA
jgi:hypothetical protein